MVPSPRPRPAQGAHPPPDAGDEEEAQERADPNAVSSAGDVDYHKLARGPFGDVLPARALARGRYTVKDQLVDLRGIPQRPRKVFNVRHLFVMARRVFELFSHRPTRFGRVLSKLTPYPYPFRRVRIRSFDGTNIAGWLGLQPGRRPGVVLVPGLFSSKDDRSQRRRALRFWRKWNYNVLVIDLRGFGQSEPAPNTPGWKEAEDVLAAARFLDAFNTVSRVAVAGESMGATAALLAAAQEGAWEAQAETRGKKGAVGAKARGQVRRFFGLRDPAPVARKGDAGKQGVQAPDSGRVGAGPGQGPPPGVVPRRVIQAVFATSPFAESYPAVEYLDQLPPRSKRFHYSVLWIFHKLLAARSGQDSFLAFMEESARHYGVSLDELYARSDLTRVVGQIQAPALVLHARDDDLVPFAHAKNLEKLVQNKPQVAVWMMDWGRHVEFDLLDRRWYWRVQSRFMGQWVGR